MLALRPVALALLASIVVGCGGAAATSPAPAPVAADDVTAVLRVVERWRQAHEVRSLEALAPLYAHGKDLVVTRQGVPVVGWDAVERELRTRLESVTSLRLRLDATRVEVVGGGAVVTAEVSREASGGATVVNEVGVVTLVIAPADEHGLIVSEHYSFGGR
ncbi:MAG: nuclear transport factor 2 family protein [Kofleriaceae bacterium]